MIFERVKKGGGKLFGDDIFVCPNSSLDRISYAGDGADIWQSDIRQSKIVFDSHIRSSLIENFSSVGSSRFRCEVTQSHLNHTNVRGGIVMGAYAENCLIKGFAHIHGDTSKGGVKIIDTTVKHYGVVYGDAICKGIVVDRRMRIGSGVWLRQPRYEALIEPEVCDVGVTESDDGHAYIACTRKPIRKWMKKRSAWVNAMKWPESLGIRLERIFERWMDEKVDYAA